MSKGNSQKGSKDEKSLRESVLCLTDLESDKSIWESESLTDQSLLRMNLLTRAISIQAVLAGVLQLTSTFS